jgi:hypothetical protein
MIRLTLLKTVGPTTDAEVNNVGMSIEEDGMVNKFLFIET